MRTPGIEKIRNFLVFRLMVVTFRFTKTSEKAFSKFDPKIRESLVESLTALKDSTLLETNSKAVTNLLPATHRLRVGNYRFLYERNGDEVLILKVGHRKNVYQ
ncbi:MAG: hypothetical protein QG650_943 [Patescibacteria group bacterium]|nr:hypothetical protein [Patescibacteria group bacterium]